MSKKNRTGSPNQLSLFDYINKVSHEPKPVHGSMDVNTRFRAAVSEAIKNCELSRPQISARMTELTGDEITLSMLNSWTAESKEQHRFPAIFLSAFCYVTNNSELLKILAQPAKLYVMKSPDALMSEKAKNQERIKKLQQENRRIDVLKQELEKKR